MTDAPDSPAPDDAPDLSSVPAAARLRWSELVRDIERARDGN